MSVHLVGDAKDESFGSSVSLVTKDSDQASDNGESKSGTRL